MIGVGEGPGDVSKIIAPSISQPLVDEAGLQHLTRMVGAAVMRDLIAECLADVSATSQDLRAACAAGEMARAKGAAHKLAGILGQYACPAGARVARTVAEADGPGALDLCGTALEIIAATAAELERRAPALWFRLSLSPLRMGVG